MALRDRALRLVFSLGDRPVPGRAASLAGALWFTPPRPRPAAAAPTGAAYAVDLDGATIRGTVWGTSGPRVYFMHGWGGRGTDVAALVPELLRRGIRVVTLDGPAHGGSDPLTPGSRHADAVGFGRALAAVVAHHGPAHAVVAHSLGAVAVTLALRSGALACDRLVLLAPVVEVRGQLAAFCRHLGVGPRARSRLDGEVLRRTGLPLEEFTLFGAEAGDVLVVHDRDDRLAPYGATAAHVRDRAGATLVTTEGLGHHRLLRDPSVARTVAGHLAARVSAR